MNCTFTDHCTFTDQIKVDLVDKMGGDYMVVAAAKVSTSGEEARKFAEPGQEDGNKGLINYLIKQRHGTPFEHSCLCFFVYAPILVWREWHRHRIGFSYNEESGRYKQLSPTFYIPNRERPMMKVDGWKPGRPKFTRCEEDWKYDKLVSNLKESYELSYTKYEDNLSMGFDPGLARDCLPVGIYSSCWVSCNPRSLMSFLSLRVHNDGAKFVSYPLYEIQVAAEVCETFLASGWPITYNSFIENGRVAP